MIQHGFTKPIDNPALINLLCMTRGQPKSLVQSVEVAAKRAADPSNLAMWIYVDDDDAATHKLIYTGWHRSIPFPISWLVLQRPRTLAEGFNELWRRSSNASLYMGFPADYTVITQDWDAIIRATMCDKLANGLALGYLCDTSEINSTVTIWVETAQWANFTGQILVPYFIDVEMLPMDTANKKTRNMRDLYFWRRFFHVLLLERIDTAQRMLDHIHPPHSPSRKTAIEHMNAVINNIESHTKKIPNKILNAVEAQRSLESGPPSVRYLEALRSAKEHLREMAPRIKGYNAAAALRSKVRLLTNEMTIKNHDRIIS